MALGPIILEGGTLFSDRFLFQFMVSYLATLNKYFFFHVDDDFDEFIIQ
jgi:hypothetical protein